MGEARREGTEGAGGENGESESRPRGTLEGAHATAACRVAMVEGTMGRARAASGKRRARYKRSGGPTRRKRSKIGVATRRV